MSTTGNITRVPLPRPRPQSLNRLRLRPRCGVASAADPAPPKLNFGGTMIGELVIGLRNKCTGRWPVHFFGKIAGAAAALIAAAAPACASAEAARVPATAQSRTFAGQSVADFYRGRNDYP